MHVSGKSISDGTSRCRANVALSRPNSGLGLSHFQCESLQTRLSCSLPARQRPDLPAISLSLSRSLALPPSLSPTLHPSLSLTLPPSLSLAPSLGLTVSSHCRRRTGRRPCLGERSVQPFMVKLMVKGKSAPPGAPKVPSPSLSRTLYLAISLYISLSPTLHLTISPVLPDFVLADSLFDSRSLLDPLITLCPHNALHCR